MKRNFKNIKDMIITNLHTFIKSESLLKYPIHRLINKKYMNTEYKTPSTDI